ncbi:hypothetical protein [Caenimonas aquaedulcis]|uniref:Uncharacterized protein n=1 Tax=Caenimonas aquaedulcis TaxID=2793270 RepID=A0A931H1U4_9BURK|nr:hypothetical protein [Caenimonas aquaedulcis]MBG9386980.1 hypothetical protein [Caenimonas aquaedulcis]
MGWFKTKFGSSFFELFSTSSPANLEGPGQQVTIEDIRQQMLLLLDGINEPNILRRVRYSLDVQGLWYLRGDLLGVLANQWGEAAALEKIHALTPMFRGALPRGMTSRRSSLSTGHTEHPGDSR